MKDLFLNCMKKNNTKYFAYLRFFIIGIVLIPVILISFKPVPIVEAQGNVGWIMGSVDPEHAIDTILLSGTMQAPSSRGARCPDPDTCALTQDRAYEITALVYSIDEGASVSMTYGSGAEWHETQWGQNVECGGCFPLVDYEYEFHKTIDISSYAQDTHNLVLRATTSDGDYLRVVYAFDNIPFNLNIAPEINFGSTYQSGSISVGIRISRLQGPAESVTAAVTENVPPNSTITFSPTNSCTPNDECVVTMNVQTQYPGTPTGTYHMRITGTSASASNYAYYDLTITDLPPLTVNVTADPHIGLAPLEDVEIIVDVGGSATGPIDIQGNCGNSPLQTFSISGTSSTSYHFTSACDYYPVEETSYMVSATVSRGGNNAGNTAMVSTTLTDLEACARSASGPGGVLDAEIDEFWPETTLEVREARNILYGESSLRGGFYAIRFNCTNCFAESGTTYVSGDITDFEYRFDNFGTWTPFQYYVDWGPFSVTPITPICISCTPCWFTEPQMYYMYAFGPLSLPVSGLSVGNHTLNLRAREEWSYAGGIDPSGYTYIGWMYQDVPFARNGWPGIELLGPANGSYLNIANPNPNFQARVTDPNINQPLRAHFQVNGFGEYDGTVTTTPGTSEWNPTLLVDGTYTWRAYASDSSEANSSWSEYWSFTKDTIAPTADIQYDEGTVTTTSIPLRLIETDERTGVVAGTAITQVSINGGAFSTINTGVSDFTYTGVNGNTYIFRYTVTDGAGNITTDTGGSVTIAIAVNLDPTATNLSLNNSDFCSASPAYFFSWVYTDGDGDTQSRFEFQVDDSGVTFPSPEINRNYLGLSNPSPTTNNQATIVLLTAQTDYLTYSRAYNWRVRVYDSNGLNSGWVNGTAFSTPTHRLPDCSFTWVPTSPNPEESVSFTDTSTCYDTGGNAVPCVSWDWAFTDGDPAVSTQQNPASEFATSGSKDVVLQTTDSFGSTCSITRQVVVGLPLPRWREIRPE
jgi:PKD repeat protein